MLASGSTFALTSTIVPGAIAKGERVMLTSRGPLQAARQRALGLSVGWSVVLVVLGLFAILLPGIAGLVLGRVLGWVVIIAGAMHLIHAFTVKGVGGVLWRLLLGILFVVVGGYLLMHPLLSLASLTLLLAVVFLLEGFIHIVEFFQHRSSAGASWLLLDGLVTLLLGLLIWLHWPSSAWWAVGLIVGIDILVTGVS